MITALEYQLDAARTINPDVEAMGREAMLTEALMGLAGESGEALELLKKYKFQGHSMNIEKMVEELGDVSWYLAEAATALNVELSDIFGANLTKLEKRYPNGFAAERSVNRNE